MDTSIEHLINHAANRAGVLDAAMKLAAKDLIFVLPLLLLALWFWPSARRDRLINQHLAMAAAVAGVLALVAGMGLASLHYADRPFVVDAATRLLISHAPDNGFPSDHGLFAFGVAGAIVWLRRLMGLAALGVAALIGVARVFVGVHWPSDVLAAAVIGLACGALSVWAIPLWRLLHGVTGRFLPSLLVARNEEPPATLP